MFDFSKKTAPLVVDETVETVTAELRSCEEELRQAGLAVHEYRQVHEDLRTAHVGMPLRVNVFRIHPELIRLEGQRSRINAKRSEILHRLAMIKEASHGRAL